MIRLLGLPLGDFAPTTTGPVLQAATIAKGSQGSYTVTVRFDDTDNSTAGGLHFEGSACCTICCGHKNGSALQLRVVNTSDLTGYTWQRTELPSVLNSTTISATFLPEPLGATVAVDMLRFLYEGEPECVLYNGVGGPDNRTAIAATAFEVSLSPSTPLAPPVLVPAAACPVMLPNGTCYLGPEPCRQFKNATCLADRCCWSPTTNGGQCLDKGQC
jgi:hypothetical protein